MRRHGVGRARSRRRGPAAASRTTASTWPVRTASRGSKPATAQIAQHEVEQPVRVRVQHPGVAGQRLDAHRRLRGERRVPAPDDGDELLVAQRRPPARARPRGAGPIAMSPTPPSTAACRSSRWENSCRLHRDARMRLAHAAGSRPAGGRRPASSTVAICDLGSSPAPSAPRAARVPRWAASTAACASGSSARPAGVRRAPARQALEQRPADLAAPAGGSAATATAAPRGRAAAPARNEPVSAIAMKYCSWRRFTLSRALGIA